jgi:hypothetical protein
MYRRQFLAATGGAGFAAALGTVLNGGLGGRQFNLDNDGLIEPGPTVDVEPVVSGFGFPTDVAFQPGADRLFLVERSGRIRVAESGRLLEEPFLDVSDRVLTEGEQGLLGLALHPDFESNRRVYVRYSAPPREGTPDDYAHTFVLSEFEATDDFRRVRPETERPVLEIPQPHVFHNAGDLAFGPEGYLYVPVGDGGDDYDMGSGHTDDWYDWNEGGNGQDTTENLLGSVLRIDVDDREEGEGYAVPDDNPLVGEEGLDEQFAWGLRNPWKLSFDGEDLYVADVGQGDYEEVNLVRRGGNYGWNVREGTMCLNARSNRYYPLFPLPSCPDEAPDGRRLRDPVIQYPHQVRTEDGVREPGRAVIGGYRYRSDGVPALTDGYVFGDFMSPTYGSGRLFVAWPGDGDGQWEPRELRVASADSGRLGSGLLGYGRDPAGELYVLTFSGSGVLSKVVPV